MEKLSEIGLVSQVRFTCSKSTVKTLEKGGETCSKLAIKTPE